MLDAEIEHDLGYKSEIAIPKKIRRNFSRLAGLLEIADKEFQEIRSFLQSYQNEAAEKVESEEFQDAEIDAVLLEAIITTNLDIAALNEFIGNCFDRPFSPEIATVLVENAIDRLHWFGIYTVNHLNYCIKNNKDNATIIAKEFINRDTTKDKSKKPLLSKTIAFFYICYAELLRRKSNYDQIMKYFVETNISSGDEREDAVHRLLQLSEKINKQS